MPDSRLRCVTCGKRFAPARTDAVYCSNGCRQRAYRERANLSDLERELEEARLRYWELFRRLAVATGETNMGALESQFVDEDGNVFMHGRQVGKTQPHRPGWAGWGLEAGGPPHIHHRQDRDERRPGVVPVWSRPAARGC
jgi:hypothetical protein